MERLQKIIASAGIASRRKAEELIKEGKVSVNGKIITELGSKVTADDKIIVDGRKISSEPKVYYLLNKPRGVISSVSDDKKRTTVVDLINEKKRIFPVGRLDYDTTGAIILTNDGDLTNIITHPKNTVPKTYIAKIEGILSMDDYFKLKDGIIVDGRKVNISNLKITKKDKKNNTTMIRLTIFEGRNHIVKKIFETLGYSVEKLKREAIGFLTIKGINSGDYRRLTLMEIKDLYSYQKRG